MLLPIVYFILLADDIAMHFLWLMLSPPNAIWEHIIYGWCYCHIGVVDVATTEADVIACCMYLLADVIANIVADVITTWV